MSNLTSVNDPDVDNNTISVPASIVIGVLSSGGWLGCVLVLLLSAFSPLLNGDFKYFVANLAIIDIISASSWIAYLIFLHIYPDQKYPFVINLLVNEAILGNYLSSIIVLIPNTLSRLTLLGSVNGEEAYAKYFSTKAVFTYFLIVDLYAYVLIGIYSCIPSIIIALIYLFSFLIGYIFVGVCSFKLYRILKKNFLRVAGAADNQDKARRDIVRAMLYQAIVPLTFQLCQVLTALLYALPLFSSVNLKAEPWLSVRSVVTAITSSSIALNPIANVVIAFVVLKPYRRAFRSAVAAVLPCVGVVRETDATRNGSMMPTSQSNALPQRPSLMMRTSQTHTLPQRPTLVAWRG